MQSDISTKVLFSTVSGTLERIQGSKKLQNKVAILSDYFQSFAKFRSKFIENSDADCVNEKSLFVGKSSFL